MTKQKSSKQIKHVLPEAIKKELERFLRPIKSVSYVGEFAVKDGNKVLLLPTFAVNNDTYVYVYKEGHYQYERIIRREERMRKFGEDVRKVMDEHGFSWELGKVIVRRYDIESNSCYNLCEKLKEVREDVLNNHFFEWKKRFGIDPTRTMFELTGWHGLDHWLNMRNPKVYNAVKDYLFANLS